jgi:hypothetical protein
MFLRVLAWVCEGCHLIKRNSPPVPLMATWAFARDPLNSCLTAKVVFCGSKNVADVRSKVRKVVEI